MPDRIKLLLVDDEEAYVNVLANRLMRRDMDVTKAYSGSEASRPLEVRTLISPCSISRWRTWTH